MPELQPFRITSSDLIVAHQPSTEEISQNLLSTLRELFSRVLPPEHPELIIDRLLACPVKWPVASAQALWDRMQDLYPRSAEPQKPNEKIVEATARAAEQRTEQATAQPTAARTEPARTEQRQTPMDPAQASARHSRKNS